MPDHRHGDAVLSSYLHQPGIAPFRKFGLTAVQYAPVRRRFGALCSHHGCMRCNFRLPFTQSPLLARCMKNEKQVRLRILRRNGDRRHYRTDLGGSRLYSGSHRRSQHRSGGSAGRRSVQRSMIACSKTMGSVGIAASHDRRCYHLPDHFVIHIPFPLV